MRSTSGPRSRCRRAREILTLRTHKRDGSTREPEEINGKEAISAADVAIGDYIEWEYLEARPPAAAFAPGFLIDRFFFQSFDAPMARSELVLVSPAGIELELDSRAGAPRPQTRIAVDGTRVTTFLAVGVQQLFAERAAVPAIEYVPSVRASSGVGLEALGALSGRRAPRAVRSSPDVRAQASLSASRSRRSRRSPGAGRGDGRMGDRKHRGRRRADRPRRLRAGPRTRQPHRADAGAGRELGIPARPVLARSLLIADPGAAVPPQELDDFADALVELDLGAPASRWSTPICACATRRSATSRLVSTAPACCACPTAQFALARKTSAHDSRVVDMTIRIDEQGGGVAVATEQLAGWPALEWAELLERFGADRARLRQDFEQRWLGLQFPGARLRELDIELPRAEAGASGTARVRYSFSSARLAVPTGAAAPRARTKCASRRRFSARNPGAASRPNRSARRR